MTTPLVKLISKAVNKGLTQAKAAESATLVKVTAGTRTAGSLASGTNASETSYPCKGFDDNEKHERIGETLVDSTHRVICLVGDSLGGQIPASTDKVTIAGVTLPIVDVEGSPAMWTCLCQK